RGVAVGTQDLVDGQAQVIGEDRREGRLVALAVGRGAGVGRHGAAWLDAHHRALERPEAAHLDVTGHADAEELRILPLQALLLLGAELRVARPLERLRERALVLPAVVVLAGRRRVRKRARRDEVLAPDLLGRPAQR